jgi:hypothetical protein
VKRNWDTIRKIMLKLEDIPDEGSVLESGDLPGVDGDTVFYHMRLMIEAGLAVGGCPELLSGPSYGYLNRLTWDGHELLDKIRRDTVWNKIKETARTKGVDLSVEVVKATGALVIARLMGS